jgi:hypothetical protein
MQEETILLSELWADERVQEQLENTLRRNIEILRGYARTLRIEYQTFKGLLRSVGLGLNI